MIDMSLAIAGSLALAAFCAFAILCHAASIATVYLSSRRRAVTPAGAAPPVSIVRTLYASDNFLEETLASTFALSYPDYEIIFCVARDTDPAVPIARRVIAAHPGRQARLLVGLDRIGPNPKLNNLAKGWNAARHDLIVLVDSNVLMTPNYVWHMLGHWGPDTGVVTTPPIGSRPTGFWAEMECAFLNTYQARWQVFADRLGIGYAHGKNLMLHKSLIARAGGISALTRLPAEDAAITWIAREAGLRITLSPRPFAQPLGRRSAREVWRRQLRWAKLRRRTFPIAFIAEPLSGSIVPFVSAGVTAAVLGWSVPASVGVLALLWYGAEIWLARSVKWASGSAASILAMPLRDLSLPFLWVAAWVSDVFEWGGEEVSTTAKLAPVDDRITTGAGE